LARAIRGQVLIAAGGQDDFAPRAASDAFVRLLQSSGRAPAYLLYPDEGRDFSSAQNRLSFFGAAENFFARCLGGLARPLAQDLNGSSVLALAGVNQYPGLAGVRVIVWPPRARSEAAPPRPAGLNLELPPDAPIATGHPDRRRDRTPPAQPGD